MADNIDHNITARVQTKGHHNRSLHWTHQFAIKDKVVEPKLEQVQPQKSVADLQLGELLPNKDVQENLVWQWAVLVSRVITKYIPAFRNLQSVVIWHIPHKYSKEMATKSELVSTL